MTPLPSRLALECMDSEPARAAQNTIDPDPLSADDQRSVGGRDRHDDVFHLFFVLGWLHGRGGLEDEEACGGINLYSEDGTLSGASAVYKGQTQRAFCSDESLYRFHLSFLVVLVFGKVAGAGGSGMGSCGNVYGECSGQREREIRTRMGFSFSRGSRSFQGVFLGPGLAFVVIGTMAAWWVAHRVHIGQLQNTPTKTFSCAVQCEMY